MGDAITIYPYIIYLNPEDHGLVYGDYNLRAIATDDAGNTDTAPEYITVSYTDLTPPGYPRPGDAN